MSSAIKCISCGAVSYNEFGETKLHCHTCHQGLIKEIDILLSHANALALELKMMYRDYTPVYFEDPWETSPALIAWNNLKAYI